MNDPRISQLQVAQPLSGEEIVPIVQFKSSTKSLYTVATTISALKDSIVEELYPPGAIVPYASDVLDASIGSWMLCDGRSISRTEYSRLFAAIGTTYGSADTSSFNIPQLKGRTIVGYCSKSPSQTFDFGSWNNTLQTFVGSQGGEFQHKLTNSEVPLQGVSIPVNRGTFIQNNSGGDVLVQTISWRTAIDGSDFFDWQGNTLTVRHRNWQGPGRTTVNYKTINQTSGTTINEGTYTTTGGTGKFVLPFNVVQATNATISSKTGRGSISITEAPSFNNSYKTTVLFNDDGPASNAWYSCTLTLTQNLTGEPIVFLSNTNTFTNTLQPYMCLNYIIKY